MIRIRSPNSRAGSIRAALALLATVALLMVIAIPAAWAVYCSPFVAHRYAVATDHLEASRAGAEVLRAGGNAVDGAIAAALALGVVNPSSSGFGGGGFATVCSAHGECTFFDFRETAPSQLTVQALRNAADPAVASTVGGLAVGVPGEPRGFVEMSRRLGRLGLSRVVTPAVDLARNGFTVSEYLAFATSREHVLLARDPLLAREFLPAGQAVLQGARVRRPLLATTLQRYGREREHFVDGALADAIAHAAQSAGGVLTAEDVRNYRPVERHPLTRPFRGLTVVTAPPPSAGGVILLETLAWIDATSPASLLHGSSAYDHVLASAWRGAFDDRARYVGDPDARAYSAEALLAAPRLAQRISAFDPAHVRPVTVVEPPRDNGTSHVCVVDADGMMVSLTSTVNLRFGARFAVPDMDIVLNDQIDDFSLGTPGNNFGMSVSQADALAPGRRPVSSMAPTILLRDGHPVGCVGASGGSRIPTATSQVLLNMVLFGMDPEAAVSAPRVHDQGTPDQLLADVEVPEDVRAALRARGYTVANPEGPLAAAQAIWVQDANGSRAILAASDPRKQGTPAGE